MLERIVEARHLAELHRPVHVPVEPQFLEVRDVAQVPDDRTHQDIVLNAEFVVGQRLDQPNRPLSRFAKKLGDALDCRIGCIDAGARLKGFCHR
jgi:hypothetical protein